MLWPFLCLVTLLLYLFVVCVFLYNLAGKTIIVYTASFFAQERKDLTIIICELLKQFTTVLCSVDQTLNCVNELAEVCCLSLPWIIRTVVRIVGMGRMSHIYNTKCSRLRQYSNCTQEKKLTETFQSASRGCTARSHKSAILFISN